jgi:arylformamidase
MSVSDLAAEAGGPRARLDADYAARDCVPPAEFDRIMDDYGRLSQVAHALPGARRGLRYDRASDQTLDLFGTAPGQARPLFVFIHGGYWRLLSKDVSSYMAPMLAARGIACAVPDYTLAPAAGIGEIVRQMRAALAWLWHTAPDLGIDRARIVVGGSSAGGHLTGTLLQPGWQAAAGLPDQPLAGALPVSGLYDLAPLAACYVNDWMQFTADEVAGLSPARHPPPRPIRCPVAVAEVETPAFHRHAAAYARVLGAPLLTLAGCNHFDAPLQLTDSQTPLSRALLALV